MYQMLLHDLKSFGQSFKINAESCDFLNCLNYHTKQQVDLPFVFLRCFSGSKSKLFDHNSPKLSLIRIN